MIKLLIGGSPCTFWSIAQKNNRETKAEGLGWELFKNYLIAKEKFKPDFFLYENNKSAAQAIKDQIKRELEVWDGSLFSVDTGSRYIEINSSLVSAQNRQRFYVHNCGDVPQPQDRGILLRDILESGENLTGNEKSYALTTRCSGAIPKDTIERRRHTMVAEPIRVGGLPRPNGEISTSQGKRIYSVDGKSVCLSSAQSGGNGDEAAPATGLYAVPVAAGKTLETAIPQIVDKYGYLPEMFNAYNRAEITDKAPTLSTGSMVTSSCAVNRFENIRCYAVPCEWDESGKPIKAISSADGKSHTVYEVKGGLITIKGKQYPIKLADGFYIIRKLTPVECERLQTLPDGYTKAVSDTQRYKGLGNGWTAEVIIHILNGALANVPRDEEIVVLSMYDGIATGRYCLDKMGFTNVKYYAYEIDKHAMQIALSNYPDIIQKGDAFQLRNPDWTIGY